MKRRAIGTVSLAALASAALLSACGSTPSHASGSSGAKVSLLETGSTLLYPLFLKWVPSYEASHKNVIVTPAGTGSGTGISEALAGTVQIGASDAYMSNAEMAPGILNIPLTISAQVVAYNVPGLNGQHLKLSAGILAGIYSGSITRWNAPQIAAVNPGAALPNHAIIPIRRSDSSGDSFLFTSYLTDSAGAKWSGGYSTAPNWPQAAGEISEDGNGGMVDGLKANPYSIAYVGISYLNSMEAAGLGYAALQNKEGRFVLPSSADITAAALAMVGKTPADERVSLIDAPGFADYPIINYEYAIVQSHQPNASTAEALKTFLQWAISARGGNAPKYLNAVHFLPLPASVAKLSTHQINEIR